MATKVKFNDNELKASEISNGLTKKKKNNSKNKGNNKTFLEIHYETVIILLRLKTNSYEKAFFLLIVLTFLVSVTNINNFLMIVKV